MPCRAEKLLLTDFVNNEVIEFLIVNRLFIRDGVKWPCWLQLEQLNPFFFLKDFAA